MHGPRPQRPLSGPIEPYAGDQYTGLMVSVLTHELSQSPRDSPLGSPHESPAFRSRPLTNGPRESPREPPSSRESPTDSFSDIGSDPLMEVNTVVPFNAPPVQPSATPSELFEPHSDSYEEPSNLYENSYENSYEYSYVDGAHLPPYHPNDYNDDHHFHPHVDALPNETMLPRDDTVYFEATDHSLIAFSPQNVVSSSPPHHMPIGIDSPNVNEVRAQIDLASPVGHHQPARQSMRQSLRRPMRYTPGPPSEEWEELDDDIDSEPTTPVSSAPSVSRSVSPKPDVDGENSVFGGGVLRQRRFSHINDLPDEVISNIVSYVSQPHELVAVASTQKRWFPIAVSQLWTKPVLNTRRKLLEIVSVLGNHSKENPPSTDYASLVQRLSLNYLSFMLDHRLLEPFASCVNLQRLSLANCVYISDVQCAMVLRFLPNLESLDLQNTSVGNLTAMSLASYCEVQTLLLGCPNLHDSALMELGIRKGQYLRRLRLADCPFVTFGGVLFLTTRCPRLVELNIADLGCCSDRQSQDNSLVVYKDPGFTDSELREVFTMCPQLKELLLSNCILLTSDLFSPWSSGLTIRRLENLRNLSLVGSAKLTDTGVRHLVAAAPRLRQINLSKCPFITDRSLSTIANAYRSQLVHLHLGHCENITDKGVRILVEKCPRLNFFDAGNCKYLTDASLYALATLPKLRRIGLVRCPNIGHQGVISLAFPQPGVPERPLERLHLSYCPKVTLESVLIITNYCKRLVHLSLTGIPCFLTEDILSLRRAPPEEFTAHQRDMFCVFSGIAIKRLRNLLNSAAALDAQILSEQEWTW